MKQLLLVACGGALGAVMRYLLSGLALQHAVDWRFPLGTFLVNISGCLIIGLLGGLVVKQDLLSVDVRLFLFTGLLGGYTTFSSFGLETFYLLRRGETLIAGSYITASVVLGLFAVWLGFSLITIKN